MSLNRSSTIRLLLALCMLTALTVALGPVAYAGEATPNEAAAQATAPPAAAADAAAQPTTCAPADVVQPSPAAATAAAASLPDGALDDLERSAEQEGITLEEAIDSYAWHEAFAQVAAELRDTHAADYAGARIEDHGEARAWVAFAGTTPAAAVDLVRTSPVPVEIREHCGHTEAELKQQLEKAHYAIVGRPDVADVSSAYDLDTGRVTVQVEPAGTVAPGRRTQLRADLRAAVPDAASDVPVDVQVIDDVVTGDDITIIGGRAITTCTTGFNVAGHGYRGTTTAGHCGNSQSYSGRALTFMGEHQGRYGDLQWHRRAGETFTNEFDSGNSIRGVFGTGAAVENQRLCRNGKTSGYTCDTVYQLNHCNGNRCGLVAMDHRYASGGDSGGPWFYNNTAYGIHQGYKWWNLGYRDLYTPVVYLPSALGVRVVTS